MRQIVNALFQNWRWQKVNTFIRKTSTMQQFFQYKQKQVGNCPSRRPAQGSKIACFEYAKEYYCEKFLSNLQCQIIPIRLANSFFTNSKHQKTQFLNIFFQKKSHSAKNPKGDPSSSQKTFLKPKMFQKVGVEYPLTNFAEKSSTVPKNVCLLHN